MIGSLGSLTKRPSGLNSSDLALSYLLYADFVYEFFPFSADDNMTNTDKYSH